MIFRLIIGIVLFYLLFKLVRGWKTVHGPSKADLPAVGEDLVEDPLCHTYVPVTHAHRLSIDGMTVYFCSQKCLELYKEKNKRNMDAP
jgi:YHS domain-containing protein